VPRAVGGGKKKKGGGGADLSGWVEPPKKLANKVLRAVLQHGMLRPGDRVLLGLSGGKDSLSLLHVLHALQKRTPFKWELGACTVDPNADGFDPSPLIPYCKRLGVPYYYEKHDLFAIAEPCVGTEANPCHPTPSPSPPHHPVATEANPRAPHPRPPLVTTLC
jgi:hypothetical protein